MRFEQITFFRPEEVKTERSALGAGTYNRSRLLLRRNSSSDCQFVPIRTMQYQGVITEDEIIFIDSQGYAVRDGEGGRIIVLAWKVLKSQARETLTEPVPIEVVHYCQASADLQRRLLVEFDKAMRIMLDRQLEADESHSSLKVIPINR